MKNIVKIAGLALLMEVTACQERLDANNNSSTRGNTSAVYMNNNNASVSLPKSTESGNIKFEVRISNLRSKEETITVATTDFFAKYNEKNSTSYKMLPASEYTLLEEGNVSSSPSNDILKVTIKPGQTSAQIGIRVRPLDEDTYPMGVKYAIPLRIVLASLPILSSKGVVVTLSRPFKTSVIKTAQGYTLGVEVVDNVPENDEFTVQGLFLFKELHAYNSVNVNMSPFQDPILSYTRIDAGKIQVKNGGGDSPNDWALTSEITKDRWCQITFTYKDSYLEPYVGGKLIKAYQRLNLKVSPGMRIDIENTQTSYFADRYLREFRVWNRVPTDAEIVDGLCLSADPDAKGLVVYLPINKKDAFKDMSKYNSTTIYRKGISRHSSGVQDSGNYIKDVDATEFGNGIEWTEDMKFPVEGLKTEQ